MREHKHKKHGAQSGSGASNKTVTKLMGDVGDISLKEELEACKHFLVKSEL